eukprot:c42112_g1_i1 orf=168-362(-)
MVSNLRLLVNHIKCPHVMVINMLKCCQRVSNVNEFTRQNGSIHHVTMKKAMQISAKQLEFERIH